MEIVGSRSTGCVQKKNAKISFCKILNESNYNLKSQIVPSSFQIRHQGKSSYTPINCNIPSYISCKQNRLYSVSSDHPQSQKSSCQVFSQHPHLVLNHPNLVLNQPQQTQQAPVNKSQPSLASHQQQQLKNTNLAATSIAKNQQSNQSNTHQQQLSRQSNFPSLQPCQQLHVKQCGNSSMLQTMGAMERQTQQIALALVPTQGQQSEPKLPQRQLISQSQQKQTQQPPNPSQVVMGNFQTSGMLKHVIGQEIIVQI